MKWKVVRLSALAFTLTACQLFTGPETPTPETSTGAVQFSADLTPIDQGLAPDAGTVELTGTKGTLTTALNVDQTAKVASVTISDLRSGLYDATVKLSKQGVPVGTGSGSIRATEGVTNVITVTIIAVETVSSLKLNKASVSLAIGAKETLVPSILPATMAETAVTWVSSDESVASVATTGKVTGLKYGTTVITASAGGKSAYCLVTVPDPAEAITKLTFDKKALELVAGEPAATLVATLVPADSSALTWISSDPSVATVAAKGATATVTPVSPGFTLIEVSTATAGWKATCLVVVTAPVAITGPATIVLQ